jgi:hypothetical protein
MGRVGEQAARALLPAHNGRETQLQSESKRWNQMTAVIAGILQATPEEL